MVKIIKMQKILVEEDKILKLAKEFGCCRAAVYNAIAYRTNSKLAQAIRESACNKHGGIITKIPTRV